MDITATKLELIGKLIDTDNEYVLERVRTVLDKQEEERPLHSHPVTGPPFTEGLFDAAPEASEEVFKMGDVLSHPNVSREFNLDKD